MKEIQDFDSLQIKLASPEQIRAWSYGEVKKPETINYRTLRPEKDGLFCERIFGTTKEWECYCGKFKSIRYKGVICDRCGVEVTHFKVRRERMGHIELASPVSHIWYYRSVPSRMGLLLDLSIAALRSILYYEKYVVIEAGDTDLKKMQLLSEEEFMEAQDRYGMSFTAGIGAEAVRSLLEGLDLDALSVELRAKMVEKGPKADKRLLKRIEIVENFRDSGNRSEWMILDVIPVIPPELRPMVQLDGGRFATSDLNDLYRRVINRNNRLKRLMALNAPDIIIRNEKRMLQEAVDALFDNSKKKKVVKGASNRPLKSLSDLLKGKQGRFRQNLLGKRVDYSGRSVIVVGPNLKLHQCGLPAKMALELYKPFIMKKLVDKDIVYNIKKAKTLVEQETPEVWAVLDEVVKEHPVLLNRAPTLHRLGIQAFEPVLVEGKAIRLHPLVCHAFNADFDGDQMAVHVPLTHAAQIECWTLMLSDTNLMNPANGQPVVFPSQDMVLGLYHLTKHRPGAKGEGRYFTGGNEVLMALDSRSVAYQAMIKVKIDGEFKETTPGRVIFNELLPKEVDFVNETLGDKQIRALITETHEIHGSYITVRMLDTVKDTGYKYATKFGASIGMDDIIIPENKKELIDAANAEVSKIQGQYLSGHITQEERYNRVVEVWSKTNEELTNVMMETLKHDKGGFNNVFMMADSGARGSRNQIRQLAGMRGLMAKPSGDIIELPIRSNFKEGLSVIEFFISTNGARKGLADTALKTADAGYLTRRLVDIAQDMVVNEEDCGTINGIETHALKDGEDIVESLADRIQGRFTLERVKHPITGEVIIDVNEEITDEIAKAIEEVGVEAVKVRTVLTCEAKHGVCRKCYGRDLSTKKTVNIGEAVGIIAAQSIGQPGTQLTMRTFHVGGTASTIAEDNRVSLRYPVLVREINGTRVDMDNGSKLFTRKGAIIVAKVLDSFDLKKGVEALVEDGQKVIKGESILKTKDGDVVADRIAFVSIVGKKLLLVAQDQKLEVRNGSTVQVATGAVVPAEEALAYFDPFSDPIIAEQNGTVKFEDIIIGTTLREEVNEDTGNIEKKITDFSLESLQPRIVMLDSNGEELASYYLPGNAYLNVEDGTKVKAGRTLAKMLKESTKTQDITGGLPRVGELFEARKPRVATVMSRINGKVRFDGIVKGKRVLTVVDPWDNEFKHLVPMGKHLLVRDGDLVEAGEPLCEGSKDPHDILDILGENALQQFLVDEVQEVYRMQGVNINDKHIGVIIRQMMRKIEIIDVGDTHFIYGQQIDKYNFRRENERVKREGGESSIAIPLLLGITRASLNIDSWISAASFQETTRVLTNAAIAGDVDHLRGLKENVVIGHIIPAGTGMKKYRNMKLFNKDSQDLDSHVAQILENRKKEQELASMNREPFDESYDEKTEA
ncbi:MULTISPECIES: DNA-directed RNA polymerase subunit beta' [unclassified Oceanispirochaeta]|uniref:DNA-directed RNA polymerase subunit beta' n=1 Tax=unclassified Oceanispirochaeta TaxID=2635722 RepID=UPI000E09B29C|nr:MULTISPECIES: DNA-directed RNA polymerase subunit beta' [unclassified Oceanispirochaeta]MBF9017124.1 DNA-directed RNA polymerase subunit beta' [Oceanispirochaeta sp. M2]NPD73573.1 DNA-directed RNA polymerase subunit beta' [Oceanispirochaeta sp. M1]RDG30677.1 DNA-directed RNA polymerase subunit beta' [Oceanispirochaeta sp. M1]